MRGNHRIWGRQDYTEPLPLAPDALARVAACTVEPRWPDRTKPHNWHQVHVGGVLVGFVATRLAGQYWRTPDMEDWLPAANDWNRADHRHAHAILRLLEVATTNDGVMP